MEYILTMCQSTHHHHDRPSPHRNPPPPRPPLLNHSPHLSFLLLRLDDPESSERDCDCSPTSPPRFPNNQNRLNTTTSFSFPPLRFLRGIYSQTNQSRGPQKQGTSRIPARETRSQTNWSRCLS